MPHDVALQLHGHKDDLALCGLGHRLKRLELPDLHGRRAGEDVRRLTHKARGIDFGTRSDDLTLSEPLLLGGGRERGGDLGREDDVLDQDALDGDTPLVCDVADDLGDLEGDGLPLGDNGLHSARTDDVAEGRLSTLDESLAQITDAEC